MNALIISDLSNQEALGQNKNLFFFWSSTFVGSAWSIGCFIPATTANDLRLWTISIPDLIHYIYFPILILLKEPVYPFSMLSAKQGNYWYHFYNVFGMTRCLAGDWTRDLPHSIENVYALHVVYCQHLFLSLCAPVSLLFNDAWAT